MITVSIQTVNAFREQTFGSFKEFADFHLGQQFSCHYEIINGLQNLYLDVDQPTLSEPGQNFVVFVVDKLKAFAQSLTTRFAVLVYTSSDTKKTSYHFVLRGVHFADHKACGQAAKAVASDVSGFDAVVYTANRKFRLLGSRKIDSTRVKTFLTAVNQGYYTDAEWEALVEDRVFALRESFVSLVDTNRSTAAGTEPALQPVAKTGPQSETLADTEPVFEGRPLGRFQKAPAVSWSEKDKAKVLELVNDKMPGVYALRDTSADGQVLNLKRLKSAKCLLCSKTHDNEGAFVVSRRGKWFFYCRRDTSSSLPLEEEDDEPMPVPFVRMPAAGQAVGSPLTGSDAESKQQLIDLLYTTCQAECTFYPAS